eukprot:1855741-Amphidinium_carterae.1
MKVKARHAEQLRRNPMDRAVTLVVWNCMMIFSQIRVAKEILEQELKDAVHCMLDILKTSQTQHQPSRS